MNKQINVRICVSLGSYNIIVTKKKKKEKQIAGLLNLIEVLQLLEFCPIFQN